VAASLLALLLVARPGDLDAARRAFDAQRFDEAIDLLGDLADAPDAAPEALLLLARAQRGAGRPDAAVEPYLRASDALESDRALAKEAAEDCLEAFERAEGPGGDGYLQDARRMARRAGEPLLLGRVLLLLRDFEGAIPEFAKVERGAPGRAAAIEGRAQCLFELGREPESRAAYGELLDAAIEGGDLALGYRAAFRAGLGGKLLDWLDRLDGATPGDLRIRRYRGFARSQMLLYKEAAEDLRFVTAARPDDLAARNGLVYALLQVSVQAQDREARKEAEAAAVETVRMASRPGTEPEHARFARENLLWIGSQHWAAGELEAALGSLRVLVETDPSDTRAGLNFGAIARRLGLHDEAKAVYDRLLEADPEDPDVLNDLGILVDGNGDRAGAVALWRKVLGIEPDNLDALENLHTSAWEAGELAAAREYAERGLEVAGRRQKSVERWRWFRDRLSWAPSAFPPEGSDRG